MKRLERISDGLGWFLYDGWDKGGQRVALTRQASPFSHNLVGRFKDGLEKSVLAAQFLCSSIAVSISILGKPEFTLMNSGDIDLNLLEMFTLAKVHTHFSTCNLG